MFFDWFSGAYESALWSSMPASMDWIGICWLLRQGKVKWQRKGKDTDKASYCFWHPQRRGKALINLGLRILTCRLYAGMDVHWKSGMPRKPLATKASSLFSPPQPRLLTSVSLTWHATFSSLFLHLLSVLWKIGNLSTISPWTYFPISPCSPLLSFVSDRHHITNS